MRVNEVITESLEEEVLDEFSMMNPGIKAALLAKGYKFLGQGVDQAAYLEPDTGHILKIFGTQGRQTFSKDHKMFFEWASFCEQHQDNKFLPRFYGHESFMWKAETRKTPSRYLMIRTEQLYESGELGKAIGVLGRLLNSHRTISAALHSFKNHYPDRSETLAKKLSNEDITVLAETISALIKLGRPKRWRWDLHHGNIMLRKDGTPVLNDPWVVGS
jgi:hypothetical protein